MQTGLDSSGSYTESGSGGLPKLNGDFLVQRHVYDKISNKIRSVFPEITAKLWRSAQSRSAEEFFNIFLDQDPAARNFLNIISSSSSTDMSLVKFHKDPISRFLCNRKRERQTNAH